MTQALPQALLRVQIPLFLRAALDILLALFGG
jgi:hypothetical protein